MEVEPVVNFNNVNQVEEEEEEEEKEQEPIIKSPKKAILNKENVKNKIPKKAILNKENVKNKTGSSSSSSSDKQKIGAKIFTKPKNWLESVAMEHRNIWEFVF